MLTPSDRHAVDQSTYVAVDQGCPSASAGLARDIKRVTVVGNTAIVVENVAGVLSSIGTVTDTFIYSNGQWNYSYPPSVLSVYEHGSVSADIAAARSAGYCAH